MTARKPRTCVSATKLGAHIDVSRQRVMQLVDEGVLKRLRNGTFDQDACRLAYIRWLRSEDRRASKSAAASKASDVRSEEIRLRIAERKRQLIEVDEHDAVLDEIVGIVRSELAGLPARVTKDVALRRTIGQEVNGVLQRASERCAERSSELRAGGPTSEADAAAAA